MAMQVQRLGKLSVFLAVTLLLLSGCRGPSLPPPPLGVVLTPGHYVREFYAAPDFDPARHRYYLTPFEVQDSLGVEPAVFAPIFQTELAKAFQANGLALSDAQADCRIQGTVHQVRVASAWRFVRGKISGTLKVSGTISQGGQPVFAFRDAVHLESPLAPGPAAPREAELLLRQLSRTFAQRLLNQLLLYGLASSG